MHINQVDSWYKRANLSKNTKQHYKRDITGFILFCESYDGFADFPHDKQKHIFKEWLLTKNIPARARAIAAIKHFRAFCKLPEYSIKAPRLTKKIPRITDPEHTMQVLNKILEPEHWISIRNYTIALIMYSCGLRVSECLSLTNKDLQICMQNSFINVLGKGDKMRMVPVLPVTIEGIKMYLSSRPLFKVNHDYAFVSARGIRLHARDVQRFLAKFNITPHVLRHNFATDMINNGASIATIRKLLGHSNMTTTAKYTHVSFQAIKKQFDKSDI